MRKSQSLGGTDGLSKNSLPYTRLQSSRSHQIHPRSQYLLQTLAYREVLEETNRDGELDQRVDIAGRRRLVARHGSEERQRLDPMPFNSAMWSCSNSSTWQRSTPLGLLN